MTYAYDAADRLINTGYTYDTQGDITTTPSTDAGGTGDLTATYYANNMLDTQAQNGTTYTWALDVDHHRYASSVVSTGAVTTTEHYANDQDSPSWTVDSSGAWSRNVLGIDGKLAAVVTGTALTYGYLGAFQRSSAALGGTMVMGARGYNTSTGRFDQADPVGGGSADSYAYTDQNPLTTHDLSGAYSYQYTYWMGWFFDTSSQDILHFAVTHMQYLAFPGCPNTVHVGSVCYLLGMYGIRITCIGYTYFGLLSLPGHIEGANKPITFWFHGGINQYLMVTVSGPDSAASAAPDRDRFAAHVLLGFALLPEAAALIAIGILVARRSGSGLRRLLTIVSAAELVSLFALGIMFTGI